MSADLRRKLEKLDIKKGARHIAAAPPRPRPATGLRGLIDGELVETDFGRTFIHTERYAPDYVHGAHTLGEALDVSGAVAARLAGLDGELTLRRAAFIDTETTGLQGGTGTYAFLIGVGMFEADRSFAVRQYFLRSPDEEAATLKHLSDTLDGFDAIVSFNGRGFDVPVLATRFTLARLFPRILSAPHLDLLLPARRLWRSRLASCSLSSLEDHILGVRRDQADIPGALIPQLYIDYVRTGDAGELSRVFYHNAVDILSMVTLAAHLIRLFDQAAEADRTSGDLLALGRWHADHDQLEQAERCLRAALESPEAGEARTLAAAALAALYKQLDRRAEAIVWWEQAAQPVPRAQVQPSIDACEELAKHYEWHERDLPRALHWTQHALTLADQLPGGYARDTMQAALDHRRQRLTRKLRGNG